MPLALPSLPDQAERLVELGPLPDGGGHLGAAALRSAAADLAARTPAGALLVIHPRHLPPSAVAPHLRRSVRTRDGVVEREGFVVVDMPDVDEFAPTVSEPGADVYAVVGLDRGDDLANWSPAEGAPEIAGRGRTPLTLTEGLQWVLQAPEALERNRCFMTIGSRLRKPDGSFDTRTPAVWISNGTGRDGSQRRGAAKVGWCWWGNRHTWLGLGSAASRIA
ncbi:DUF5701 family protein [Isoptericola croceus]|uniref:DUF5701 family protein n=1 Tax=Isoptericola croceus TaxID=3031406 RepID=UPI0023F760D3|nr:DUF5701 family protein [Isoptericola croceus]